jgi:uncharacterized membrane-anchored protein YitT (DUF2179 family)
VQGLIIGTLLCALGLVFLNGAGLVSGQLAGASLLISYVTPFSFGPLFFALSTPLFLLAWTARGPVFTLRSLCVVAGISVLTPVLTQLIAFEHIAAIVAAVMGGICVGIGLVSIFRHNASPGGASIAALVIEQRFGLRAGWVQLGVDGLIFEASFLVLTPQQVMLSFLGAAVMNLIVAWNFRIEQSGTGAPSSD